MTSKIAFILLSLAFSTNLLAQVSYVPGSATAFRDPFDAAASTAPIHVDTNTATTSSTAHDAFVPYTFEDAGDDGNLASYVGSTTPEQAVPYVDDDVDAATFASGSISLKLQNTTSVNKYLFAVIDSEDTSNQYVVIGIAEDPSGDGKVTVDANTNQVYIAADQEITVKIDLNQACDLIKSATACSFSSTASTQKIIAFFLADQDDFDVDDNLDSTNAVFTDNAVFFNLKFSQLNGSDITDKTLKLPSFDLERGDERIGVNWSKGDVTTSTDDIIAIHAVVNRSTEYCLAVGCFYKEFCRTNVCFSEVFTENVSAKEGSVSVLNVSNPQTGAGEQILNGYKHYVAVCIQNKWGFCSNMSDQEVTPSTIESFINEQGCYLISAGFKYDHYVLRYLRGFRDNILRKFLLGRMFISFYDSTAPKYAVFVAENPVLSFITKSIGYISYYLIKFFYIFIIGLFALALFLKRRSLWPKLQS